MHTNARLRDLAISESGFVFDPMTGSTFTVNAPGLAVLQALKAGSDADQVAAALMDQFDCEGDEETVSRDVNDFIASLREQGLVK